MLFNSLEFALFLPVVFAIYWLLNRYSLRLQNVWVVAASFFFYGWWDARFLILIAISILTDFAIGIAMANTSGQQNRKFLLYLSLVANLGMLLFFKYFNFFIDNFRAAFTFFGQPFDGPLLEVVLPVGISFYTFQTLSYTIDVYKRKLEPTRDLMAFSAFVSFFPQLVAGPIERATHLLPQFTVKRKFDYELAVDGLRLILWGFFKKLVVADTSAVLVNQIFGTYEQQSGAVLVLGAVFFSFQIYGDFSGYSDIAIGTARLFGIRLMRNFNLPYFARDIAEFWRGWHISLTTWFRDYVYIPLGGSRLGRWITLRNTLVVFLVSGFWHGANWTFIAWGVYHALLFIPLMLFNINRRHLDIGHSVRADSTLQSNLLRITTFALVTIGWVFFRSATVTDAFAYLGTMLSFSSGYFDLSTLFTGATMLSGYTVLFAPVSIGILLLAEWFQSGKEHPLVLAHSPYRRLVYFLLIVFIYIAKGGSASFIYFQF